MKHLFLLIFLVFVTLMHASTIVLTPEEKAWIKQNPVIKYSEVNWKPLSIIENNRMDGIMGDFLEIISKSTGLKFEFIPSDSWPHVLQQFSQGKIDVVPGIGSSPQETKLGLVSQKYATYPMVIVTSNKVKYLEGLKDLEGKTVAVPKFYTSYNFIVKNFPNLKLITTTNISDALLLVEEGRADAFVGHIATSLYYLAENHLKNLKVTGTTSFKFEHHYLVQKDKPLLHSIINKTFAAITYQEKKAIYSRWIQTTIVEKEFDYRMLIILSTVFILLILFLMYRQMLLKKSHKDMVKIIDSSLDGIIISQDRRCIDVNSSAMKIFGFEKEEMLGKDILSWVDDSSKDKVEEALNLDKYEPYEMNAITAENRIVPLLIKGSNVVLNGKHVRVSSFVDLTEIKQKDALLYKQSKMAALGEMIGNIAHQWRQPLTTISMAASNLKLEKELGEISDDEFENSITSIHNSTQYLSKTIDDFRSFLKPSEKIAMVVDITLVLEKALNLVEAQFKSREIKIIKNTHHSSIRVIENELVQALLNILNNTLDVLENKDDDRLLFIKAYEEESRLKIELIDNGGGISPEIIEKVFEPYFTTKHQSQGTGIGLYMSEEIVKNHLDGALYVSNKKYKYNENIYIGACFTIELPLLRE